METILVQIKNTKAYRLLQDLEDLKIIKVLRRNTPLAKNTNKSNTARFRGSLKLNTEQYADFQQHAKDIRDEWQANI